MHDLISSNFEFSSEISDFNGTNFSSNKDLNSSKLIDFADMIELKT